jgi:uncharacterized protein YggT (Ycf19 family)
LQWANYLNPRSRTSFDHNSFFFDFDFLFTIDEAIFFPFRKNPITFFRLDFSPLFTVFDIFFMSCNEVKLLLLLVVVVVVAIVDDKFAAISDLIYALSEPMMASIPEILLLVSVIMGDDDDSASSADEEQSSSFRNASRGLADREVCDWSS